ncbi:hypothetical protein ACYOEI_30145, partial [Singulisphaera rosea]
KVWSGTTGGRHRTVKLLHELREQLAVMRPSSEGTLAALFDALPPVTLREAVLIIVSTRPVNLIEEAERSARLSGMSSRGLMGRVVSLDASNGDLNDLIQFAEASSTSMDRTAKSDSPDPDDRSPTESIDGEDERA